KKIYSPALNIVFVDSFYDLGWLESPAIASTSATEAAAVMSSAQAEFGPAIEPSPIPAMAAAKTKATKEASESLSLAAPLPSPAIAGMEATVSNLATAAGTPARPEDLPPAPIPTLSPTVETPVAGAAAPASSAVPVVEKPAVAES